MSGNIFSEKYVKEKLNRLEQINSQKRLKVQQATQAKKPQMSRHEYEKYKKILFDQNKKQNQNNEEKTNDSIPTKDMTNSNNRLQEIKEVENKENNQKQQMNKSLERNRSPKAGEIIFAQKRNCSYTQKNSLNHSEILQKTHLQQQSPKIHSNQLVNSIQSQNLQQSKSLMKLSNTMKGKEMNESQISQEIPNSSRTQNVLQNMKSILSIASPNAYFSNVTSTLDDHNIIESAQIQNPAHRFNQVNQIQYTPAPISPSSHLMMQNNPQNVMMNNNQGFYPTYQTQQSIDFMNTDNPEFVQMMKNQNKFMKSSQLSNYNDGNDIHDYYQNNYNNQNQYLDQQNQINAGNFYLSPKQQYNFQKPRHQQSQIHSQQPYYNISDQNQMNSNQQLQSPRMNNFQRQQVDDNMNIDYGNTQNQNDIQKRQVSNTDIISNDIYQQQQQYFQEQQFNERRYSTNSYFDNNNPNNVSSYSNKQQQYQQNSYQTNSQIDCDEKYYEEEQQYLSGLSHLGVKEDLDQSEIMIKQLKQNQNLLKQEKEQLEKELSELEDKSRVLKSCHKKQQSQSLIDTSSNSHKAGFLEASFKKQIPPPQNYEDSDNFYNVGFQQKWDMIEKEEQETERSFMIISEYLNMQSEQNRSRNSSRHQANRNLKEINTSNITQHSNHRKQSDEIERNQIRKNSDLLNNIQSSNKNEYEKKQEDELDWLDGIEESFCELKSINKNELMPQYCEIQSHKKSYLEKYNIGNNKEQEGDAYTRLKNQIIGKQNENSSKIKIQNSLNAPKQISADHFQIKSKNSRDQSLKGSNHNPQINQESSSIIKKETMQEIVKEVKSPQFGASGKNSGFSYLNEVGQKESSESNLKKNSYFAKPRIGNTSNLNSQSQSNSLFVENQQNQKYDFKSNNSLQSSILTKDDLIQKSSSSNSLISNFYNNIEEISKKNLEKFQKSDQVLNQTDKNIQKSNEIIDKINQKYQDNQLISSKSSSKRPFEQSQYNQKKQQEEDIHDEDIRQQQYIMRKLNEMQIESNSQQSSMREKDLQYSQTISSFLAQGDSQFKRSQSPYSGIDQGSQKDRKMNLNINSYQNREENSNNNFSKNNKRGEINQNNIENINEELQVADLNNYSSFKNELQQSESQKNDLIEDQYLKLSNNKNSSFEKELLQMNQNMNQQQNNQNSGLFNISQDSKLTSQNKNLFQNIMMNDQKEFGKSEGSQLGLKNTNSSTYLFSKRIENRLDSSQQQQNEESLAKSDQKYDDKPRKMTLENKKNSSHNKYLSKAIPSDDESKSSGDELEETILQKLQKLKKNKENNNLREKSPLTQKLNLDSDSKTLSYNQSANDSKKSLLDRNQQFNKENNHDLQNSYKNINTTQSNNNSTNDQFAKMKLDDLFNKNRMSEPKEQNVTVQSSQSNKPSSTKDKIFNIQQKLNNLFEKKSNSSETQPQDQIQERITHETPDFYNNSKIQKVNKQNIDQQMNEEPRIDRKVIDNLAEEVEMLMKMQKLEKQFQEQDNENQQLKQEFLKHERHIYEEDRDLINLDDYQNQYNNQSESQKNFYKNKQQLPLYEIEEEHSIDNSIVDQNFQIRNKYF